MSQIPVVLSNISSLLSNTSNSVKYSANGLINANVYGIPLVTLGLIGITSVVLAYVTIVESDDSAQGSMQGPTQGMGMSRPSTESSIIPESLNPMSGSFNPMEQLGKLNPMGSSGSSSPSGPSNPSGYTGGKTKKQRHKNRKTQSKAKHAK